MPFKECSAGLPQPMFLQGIVNHRARKGRCAGKSDRFCCPIYGSSQGIKVMNRIQCNMGTPLSLNSKLLSLFTKSFNVLVDIKSEWQANKGVILYL